MNDAANYLLFSNPVSHGVWSGLSSLARVTGIKPKTGAAVKGTQTVSVGNMASQLRLHKIAGSNLLFLRIAGLSGATAVLLGAYGTHKAYPETDTDLRKVFETANRFHFFHSLALMAVPLARRPMLSGTLILTGMTLFCFPCYYRAFTGEAKFNRAAPVGGVILTLAWLSLVF